ncbi:hypothetical protein ACLB6G_11540 [Zhengella sp. ZM62]|uniref:hypothetical protein n=1 Tax=Zhengella sedimenti TaxID=3390035 RepID=UPI00397713A9
MTQASTPGETRQGGEFIRDETGRARLRFGDIHFETVFQPFFRVLGDKLRPDFATARIRPHGTAKPASLLRQLADGPGASQASGLARCNLAFLDPETLCFCEDHQGSANMAPAALDLLLGAARDAFMMADQLVWRLPLSIAGEAAGAVAAARESGVRVALRMGSGEDPGLSVAKAGECGADMLHLGVEWSGAWLENVPEARSLLRNLVDRMRHAGSGVSMTGISTAAQLEVALDAGVTWLQGGYLAPAVPAGRATGWQDLSATALKRPGANITVLKQRQTPRHQQY